MRPAIRYLEESWAPIDACLSLMKPANIRYYQQPGQADAHVSAYYHHVLSADAHVCAYYCQPLVARAAIEAIVHRYLWMTERFDPRSPEVVTAKACWAKIAEHAQALDAALVDLEAVETGPVRSIGYAIAANPSTPHADYLTWKQQVAAAARWATRAAKGPFPKSATGANRARGDDVDKLFADLLTFWIDRGGHAGKGINSPSTRFVVAAVHSILADTVPDVKLPRAIVDFVRERQFDKRRRIWTLKPNF
jgi:hypothetical protein